MILQMGNQTHQISNKTTLEEVIQQIQSFMNENDIIVRHVEIDGVPAENWQKSMENGWERIQLVEVKVKTLATMISEVLLSTQDFLDNATPLLEKLGEAFYQEPDKEAWTQLSELFESLQWIIQSVQVMDERQQKDAIMASDSWEAYLKDIYRLDEIIREFSEALENKDHVLVGDLLTYEVEPVFKEMQQKLPEMIPQIPNEVPDHELH
ncbi:hypothetical protein [Anoxynatronum sibiricum]|uniref:Uncharacterized protein n=1 Tax=Anoxynatronum sibiricum TaxID=210623 RepID=A0ABU9VUF6_9CLOT